MNKKKPPVTSEIREYFTELGKYGKLSGKKMTPEERRARALKANAASQEAKRRKKAAQQEGE